jgi:kynureninase
MTAARAGIGLSIKAGIDAIRAKSVALTEYAIELADTAVAPLEVSVDLPRDPAGRCCSKIGP